MMLDMREWQAHLARLEELRREVARDNLASSISRPSSSWRVVTGRWLIRLGSRLSDEPLPAPRTARV